MIDYVNVRKPSKAKMWYRKNKDSIRVGMLMAFIFLISMVGDTWLQ